ncbi:MAG: type I-C CRISPR-associated protein Cas8c/Csd1 [Ruminococcus sp.]|nr:type I-C CRISPR-associated protein Cas8c/Csd1 [Ruminococcus sp.]
MLINALCNYYDMLAQDSENDKIVPEYLSQKDVSYMIMISEDGKITDILGFPDKDERTKKNGKATICLPRRSEKSAVDLNIVEHRGKYIFGLDFKDGRLTTKFDKANDSRKNGVFREGNLEFFKDLDSPIDKAFYKFLENWKPENETENPILIKLGKDICKDLFCFALDGHPEIMLHEDAQVIEKYKQFYMRDMQEKLVGQGNVSMDAITGEIKPIADLHDKIKGLLGGQPSGCLLVAADKPAFESYNKAKSLSANVSVDSMKKYTSALNMLLSDSHHKIVVGDTTIVFFAISQKDENESEIVKFFFSSKLDSDEIESELEGILNAVRKGKVPDYSALDIDVNDSFYVVGLTPNASRISQRFIYRNKFGAILDNVILHQKDMAVKYNGKDISVGMITHELISPKSTKEKVSSSIVSELFKAILNGTNYPTTLLETVIRRVKADSDDPENNRYFIKLNDTRAGIIKACLNRRARLSNKEEEIKMGLDETNTNQAYVCGRLFAVLEKIQQEASDNKLNKTIKDSYFATAMSKPSTVFPKLFSLAQNHLAKLEYSVHFNKMLGEIVGLLDDEFPSTLSLEDQGRFVIGYYHQNGELYKKKENAQTK